MKQLMFTALIVAATMTAMAQAPTTPAKTPVVEKPQFKPDYSGTIEVKVKLPLGAVNSYLFAIQNPGYTASPQMSGESITNIQAAAQYVGKTLLDSVSVRYSAEIKRQQDKFTADTTAHKPIVPPKKH